GSRLVIRSRAAEDVRPPAAASISPVLAGASGRSSAGRWRMPEAHATVARNTMVVVMPARPRLRRARSRFFAFRLWSNHGMRPTSRSAASALIHYLLDAQRWVRVSRSRVRFYAYGGRSVAYAERGATVRPRALESRCDI